MAWACCAAKKLLNGIALNTSITPSNNMNLGSINVSDITHGSLSILRNGEGCQVELPDLTEAVLIINNVSSFSAPSLTQILQQSIFHSNTFLELYFLRCKA